MMFLSSPVVIRIDFPALEALVTYLTGKQQQQIDAMAAQIQQLTQGLHQSKEELEGSIKAQGD
jgi:hypothetical protein